MSPTISPPVSASVDATDAVIARYGALSGDAAAFTRTLGEPLPVCVWANPMRIDPPALAGMLREAGFAPEPISWHDGAFRLPPGSRPGQSWLFRAGLLQIQEEAALLSVRLLAPRPGERVLDLCAAPGNKTAGTALAVGNRGTVVANDLSEGRLAPLHTALGRLGLVNVSTTIHHGADYPAPDGSFDCVLADVPCSGEGTVRRGAGRHRPVPDDFRRALTGIQRALLRRALDLCRPGGRVLYSTCTLAPEENEAVIDAVLTERPGGLRVVPVHVDRLAFGDGLTDWQGKTFDPSVANAVRLWPHLSDTGGFFAALLEKTGRQPAVSSAVPGRVVPDDRAAALLSRFTDLFGFPPGLFAGLTPIRRGKQVRLVAIDHVPPERPAAFASGLLLTRDRGVQPKLSTEAALAFGSAATRNMVELGGGEADAYHRRETLTVDGDRLGLCTGGGYVIVRHRGFGLGLAMLRRRPGVATLESLFPKGWR